MNFQFLQNFNRVYFHCQYANHEDQLILGFCLNARCKQVSQFCFLCSKESHKSHPEDLIIFKNILMMLVDAKAIMKRNQQENDYLDYLWSDCEKMQKNINQYRFEKFQQKTKFLRQNLKIIQIFTIRADQYLEQCIQAIKDQDFLFVRKQIRIFKKINLYKNNLNKTKQLKLLYEKLDQYKSSLYQNFEYLLCRFNSQIKQQQLPVKKTIYKSIKTVEVYKNSISIDANFYMTQGQELFRIQNYELALENFNDAIQLNPQCSKAHLNKGHTLFKLKQYKEALQSYEMVSVEEQKDFIFLTNKGVALIELNSNKEAIRFLDEALKLDPVNSEIYYYRGLALLKQNLRKKAIEQFIIANDINPNPKYSILLSDVLYANQEIDLSLYYAENILKIEPKNDKALFNKGCCLRANNNFQEALNLFDQAILIQNKISIYHRKKGSINGILGCCLLDLQKYLEAMSSFEATLRLDPNQHLAYFYYGIALSKLNRFDEAQEYYTIAKSIHPNIHLDFKKKGIFLKSLRQYAKAIQCFDKAIILNPQEPLLYFDKAIILFNTKQYQEAIYNFDQSIMLSDKDEISLFLKGLSQIKLSQYKESVDSFTKAIENNPTISRYHFEKSFSLLMLKNYNEALACLENFKKLDKNHFPYYLLKGDILFESKRINEAVQCYTQALKLNPQFEELLIQKGDDLLKEQKYIEAWTFYDKVIKFNPQNKSVIKKRDEIQHLCLEQPVIGQEGNKFEHGIQNFKNYVGKNWNNFFEKY